jgi:hypothetical protein
MDPGWLYVMEYVVYHLRPFGLDIPFDGEMTGMGQSQFQLLGQSIMEEARKKAANMMGPDDLNWRLGRPTVGPQIIKPVGTTTTPRTAAAVGNQTTGNRTKT